MICKTRHCCCILLVVNLLFFGYIWLREEKSSRDPRRPYFETNGKYSGIIRSNMSHIPLATPVKTSAMYWRTKLLRVLHQMEVNVDADGGELQADAHLYHQVEEAVNRSIEYCNPPEILQIGQEGHAPDNFKLRSVHIITRHGDRSPINRMPNQDSPPLMCNLAVNYPPSYEQLVKSFMMSVKSSNSIRYGENLGVYPQQHSCGIAQLTGKGAVQHLINGMLLRSIYIDRHGLLTASDPHREVLVKTTTYSRTFQSALALMHGLLPDVDLGQLDIHVTNNINFCDPELSDVQCSCPAISQLREVTKEKSHKIKQDSISKLSADIKHELFKIYGSGVQVPWTGHILEVLMGYFCHELPLPCNHGSNRKMANQKKRCIQMPLVGKMWDVLDRTGEAQVLEAAEEKHSLLLMYPLLREIAQHMVKITHGQNAAKLVLYSGHDLTITPLAKALGIHTGHWPPYATRLILEMYSSPQSKYFIRVLYNGEDRTNSLRFCQPYILHNLCPLQHFVDFAFSYIFKVFGTDKLADICY